MRIKYYCKTPVNIVQSKHRVPLYCQKSNCEFQLYLTLKGTYTQHSGHVGQIFKTEKTVEIQPVRPNEVCGKV